MIDALLNWWSARTNKRLRLSQLRILYQNQLAIADINATIIQFEGLFLASKDDFREMIEFESVNDDAIIQLSYRHVLDDNDSNRILAVNTLLKGLYASFLEGTHRARGLLNEKADDMLDFATKFRPKGGWENFGEEEWSSMLKGSLSRLKR
jgi:hypothetical protein